MSTHLACYMHMFVLSGTCVDVQSQLTRQLLEVERHWAEGWCMALYHGMMYRLYGHVWNCNMQDQ